MAESLSSESKMLFHSTCCLPPLSAEQLSVVLRASPTVRRDTNVSGFVRGRQHGHGKFPSPTEACLAASLARNETLAH